MDRRGLSDIIATVLIILLAIAAVAIVWAFIQGTIYGAGAEIELAQKCREVEIAITKCENINAGDSTEFGISLSRGDPAEIVLLAESRVTATGETAPISINKNDHSDLGNLPETPGSISFQIGWTQSGTRVVEYAQATAIVTDETGDNTRSCDPTPRFKCLPDLL